MPPRHSAAHARIASAAPIGFSRTSLFHTRNTVKSFADRFSRAISEAEPQAFTANIRKVRRKGRIFLDWLRNQRGATAVMPYSARAREGAPVAAPVTWAELDKYEGGNHFTIRDAEELLERASSKALAGWGKAKQALPDA